MTEGPVLSQDQLDHAGWLFARTIFEDDEVDADGGETYFKFRLSEKHNPLAYERLLGNGLRHTITEAQFGYYHHRAIFRLEFAGGTSLATIRDARAKACNVIRTHCFDRVAGQTIPGHGEPDYRIDYVYSYSLLVVPRGRSIVKAERRDIDKERYDPVYSVRSTTFGFFLPQGGSLVRPRHHYVRISVPSTVVYADGRSVKQDLLDNLVDAIYYGGLYQKAKADHGPRGELLPHGPSDRWTNDLLLSVFNILGHTVRGNERDEVGIQVMRAGCFVALLAALTTVVVTLASG